ncbi:hypothetical protein [Kitasatospora sp. DSM 101779]|uniref:hypothetical protein n=1 Tax=Kitasatospora sp. DSM 101779 TaxID=2853165 RepID=UPI0021DACB22|nr:hypothetical protein [Kitasatospora sp. DSM 101779]MCU7826872.1 hypothetical protein [Kitasatospora sp. DSM 101779]
MGDFAVNTSVSGSQSQPCADALLGSELFAAVWADGADAGIKGRHVNTAGTPLGSEFLVSDTPPGNNTDRQRPFVDSIGGATFAAWIEQPFNLPPPTPHVVLRRLAGSHPGGPPVRVSTEDIDASWPPTVTRMIDRGCLVTWTGGSPEQRVRAQRFGPDGQRQGSEIAVSTSEAFHTGAAATVLSTGDFVVAWTDGEAVGGGGLRYRVFGSDGTPRTDEIHADVTGFGRLGRSVLTALDNGRFVAAHINATVPSDLGVPQTTAVASILDPAGDGDVIARAFAGSPKHFHRTSPSLTALPGGRFVLAWVEKSADTNDTVPTVMAQLCSDSELEIGPKVQVSSGTAKNRLDLSAAAVFGNGSPQKVFLSWTNLAADGDTSVRGSVLTADAAGLS